MLLSNLGLVDIHPFHEPTTFAIPIRPQNKIIPRHLTLSHLPRLVVKRPIFQTIASLPFHPIARVLILVPKLHGDAVVSKRKELFAQTVGFFFLPFFVEEGFDLVCALEEGVPVAPDGVGSIRFGYSLRVSERC
jgi:hypothetical protein